MVLSLIEFGSLFQVDGAVNRENRFRDSNLEYDLVILCQEFTLKLETRLWGR